MRATRTVHQRAVTALHSESSLRLQPVEPVVVAGDQINIGHVSFLLSCDLGTCPTGYIKNAVVTAKSSLCMALFAFLRHSASDF
jgi:hypothetical protein